MSDWREGTEEEDWASGERGELDALAPEDDPEVPSGIRRVPRSERLARAGRRQPSARAGRAGREGGVGRRSALRARARPRDRAGSRGPLTQDGHAPGSPRRSWIRRALAALLALVVLVALWFAYEIFQPFQGSGHGRIRVTIPAHSSTSQIADVLAHDGVISSAFFFEVRAALDGDRGKLRAGSYTLAQGMSYAAVLKVLTAPPPAAKVSDLTIVEGRTRRQIDALLREQGIAGNYLALTRRSRLLNPRAYGAPRSTPSLEGFLFPSTYQLRDPISAAALADDQLETFRREFSRVDLGYARRHHLTAYDVLIIASMVEAEAATPRDRPLIASVIYNRLRLRMPLQIDATTRYATGNYTQPLTTSELDSPSPYNTRIHAGLPPTPIDNPGLASIQAAAHPAANNYLYFVVKPCGNGEQVFSSSYSQFLHDAALYQQARSAHGGRSPVHC